MQQVQDQVGFKIETPDDAELRTRFQDEMHRLHGDTGPRTPGFTQKSKNALKRARRAQRRARAKNRA